MSGANLKLSLNTSNFKSELQAINAKLKEIDSTYKTNALSAQNLGNQETQLQNKEKMLIESITMHKQKLELLQDKYGDLKNKQDDYTKKINETKQKISTLNNDIQKNTQLYGANSEKVKDLKQQLEDETVKLNNTQTAFNRNNVQMSNMQIKINDTTSSLMTLNRDLTTTRTNLTNLNNINLDRLAINIRNIGDGLSNIGNSLNSAITQPIKNFASESEGIGQSFDYAMADLSATSGATGNDFDLLKAKAKDMGANTCKTATESAQAMKYLALAGYDVNQILNASEPILKSSVAWGADLAQTSDIATDSMSALGLSVDDLQTYLDTCSQAQRSSNTTAIQLGEAYISCGGMLKQMNIPLSESATWLGILANQGKQGAEAGDGLNSILVNMLGLTSTTSEALEKMGVSVFDEQGKFRGLTTVLTEVKEATKNMTEEERDSILGMLGGKTQLDTLNMLLAGVGNSHDQLAEKIKNCAGVTEDMYDTMQNSTQGKVESMKSALEALQISVFEALQPVIESVLAKLTEFFKYLNGLDNGTKKTLITIALVVASIGPLLIIMGQICFAISSIVSAYNILKGIKIVEGITKVGSFLGKIPGGISNIISFLGKLSPIWTALQNLVIGGLSLIMAHPIVALIVGITTLVVILYNKCKPFHNFCDNLFKKITNFFRNLKFEGIINNIKKIGESLLKITFPIFNVASIKKIKELLGSIKMPNLSNIKMPDFTTLKQKITALFKNIPTGEQLLQKVNSFMTQLFYDLGAGFGKIVVFFKTSIPNFFTVVIPGWCDNLKNIIMNKWDGMKQMAVDKWNSIVQFFTITIPHFFTVVIPNWVEILKVTIIQKLENLKQIAVDKWNSIVQFFTITIPQFFTVTIPGYIDALKQKIGEKIDDIKNKIQEKWESIKKFFTETIPQTFNSVIQKFKDFGKHIVNGIIEGIKSGWGKLKDTIRGWCNSFVDGYQSEMEIASPSKRMKREVGQWLYKGTVECFEDKDKIKKTITGFNREFESNINSTAKASVDLKNKAVNNQDVNFAIYLDSNEITKATIKKVKKELKKSNNNLKYSIV